MSTNNVYAERLTADNSILAMIDHQTGLMVSCRDYDPHLLRANIRGLCTLAKTIDLPSVVTASMPEGPNGPIMPDILEILGDEVIERPGEINAWDNPEFKGAIEKTGRKKSLWRGW